jgi:hypothetical protein
MLSVYILSFIEKRTKLQCLTKFSLQKGPIFSKSFAVFAEFLVLQTMFAKCGRRVCKLDRVFLRWRKSETQKYSQKWLMVRKLSDKRSRPLIFFSE